MNGLPLSSAEFTSCLPGNQGLEAEGVLNDQHFPGSGLNLLLCLFIFHVQLVMAPEFGHQTCCPLEYIPRNCGPHVPVDLSVHKVYKVNAV